MPGRGLFFSLCAVLLGVLALFAWSRSARAPRSMEDSEPRVRPAGPTSPEPLDTAPGSRPESAAGGENEADEEESRKRKRALPREVQREQVREALEAALGDSEIGAYDLWDMMSGFDAAVVVELLREYWPRFHDAGFREELLGAASMGDRFELVVEVYHLGMADPDESVRDAAAGLINDLCWVDFRETPEAYAEWRRRTEGLDREAIVRLALEPFVARARAVDPASADFEALDLGLWMFYEDEGPEFLELGGLAVLEGWLKSDRADARLCALEELRQLGAPPGWILERAPGLLADETTRAGALALLARAPGAPARALLLPFLRDPDPEIAAEAASSLARNPDAAQDLMEALRKAPSPEVARAIARYGLAEIADIRWRESHDAAWWESWWERRQAEGNR